MAENKKYYWMKLKDNFFDSDEMILLEAMPDGYLYSNILLKLYLRSLKNEGKLMFKERIPYNATIIAQVTRHEIRVVGDALNAFTDLGLIEILEDGAIYMLDIQSYIGVGSTEADRKREYRKKIECEIGKQKSREGDGQKSREGDGQMSREGDGQMSREMSQSEQNGQKSQEGDGQMSCEMSDKCPDKRTPEKEKEKDLEKDLEREIDLDLDSEMQQLEQKRLAKIAELNKHKKTEKGLTPLDPQSIPPLSPDNNNSISLSAEEIQYFIDCWSNLNVSDPIRKLNEKQTEKLTENVNLYGDGNDPLETIGYLIDSITDSSYLMGDTEHRFQLLIDWVLKPENWKKVIDGEYQNWETPEI